MNENNVFAKGCNLGKRISALIIQSYITSEPLATSCSFLHLVALVPLKSFFLFILVILSLPNTLGLVEVGLRIDTAEGIVIPANVGNELVLELEGGKLSVVEK